MKIKHLRFKNLILAAVFAMMMTSATAWAQEQQILRIHTADDWNTFAANVNNGNNYNGWIVTLENDITVTTTVGDPSSSNIDHLFQGTFNGYAHTLTFNSSVYLAPFACTYNATIANLRVEGDIYTSKEYPGGIVGQQWGTLTLRNCRSSVNIHCSRNGECGAGGLVGYVSGSVNTVIEGCLFNGSLLSEGENLPTSCGGFIGCSLSGTCEISNSLLAPTYVTIGSGEGDLPSFIFARLKNSGGSTITNSYWMYSTEFGSYQGLRAHTITAGEHISVAFAGTETVYSSTGIRSYSNGGIRYGDVLYAGNNSDANYDEVSLTLNNTPEEGYVFDHYTASAGVLEDSGSSYTLKMPVEQDVVINGVFIAPINYMNADGSIGYKAANEYTVLTGGGATSLAAGWYVVNSDINYTGKITLNGDVNIILCNGCTMNVGTDAEPIKDNGIGGGSLTIYGQTLDENLAGQLNVYSQKNWGGCISGTYHQYSGNVYTKSSAGIDGAGIDGSIRINGGKIVCDSFKTQDLIINGGKVDVSSFYITNNQTGTFNWTNADDYIKAGYFSGFAIFSKAFINQNSEVIHATDPDAYVNGEYYLSGKTIRPYGVNTLSVKGWGNSDESDHWVFIASPVATEGGVVFANVNNLINATTENYDLYRLNNTIWENSKNTSEHSDFTTLVNGRGYLYANKNDVTLTFNGMLNDATEQSVQVYEGYNLVGNPFPTTAYLSQSYYTLNNDGSGIVATPMNTSNPIMPCTGVIVEANSETVTFSTKQPEQQGSSSNNGFLQVVLAEQVTTRGSETANMIDNAIVSFNEGNELGKFYFGEQDANIYIPQGNEEYAIAFAETRGELPLNFKVINDGTYTLTVKPEGMEMKYLHLIDNKTGIDIDLMATPSYTFEARTTDYPSRFRLLFNANGIDETESDGMISDFAFFNGDSWVVSNNGEAILQVVDMMGRVVSSETVSGNAVVSINQPAGVYVMRLLNGENVRVQKVVVR